MMFNVRFEKWVVLVGMFMCVTAVLAPVCFAAPPATVNIRGQLLDVQGKALPGVREFTVQFFDAAADGAPLGGVITGQVEVSAEGLFNIPLVLPPQVLLAPEAWYEVAMASAAVPGPLTGADLFPGRVKLESVPFALEALDVTHVDVASIGSGLVEDGEFDFLSGVTSAIQDQLDAKANAADVYTKGEVDASQAGQDTVIAAKANASDVYTKGEVDSSQSAQDAIIAVKANAADVYTKGEVDSSQSAQDTAIADKVAKAGDTMTGALTVNDSFLGIGQAAAPGTPTDKLYNLGGALYWNGQQVIAGGAAGFPWTAVTANTQLAKNNGYIANSANMLTLTLPLSANISVGDVIRVAGIGAGGWKIAQNTSQSILTGTMEIPDYSGPWTVRDSARDWKRIASSADGTKLVAGVYNGNIYTSTDSGVTWTARESVRQWQCVGSSADGTKLVAGVYGGNIYTSTDSGVTWTARESARAWQWVASSADGSKLAACVWFGRIYTSTDSGVTWTARESTRYWNVVASSSDGMNLAASVYNSGLLYTSTDSGVTWTARETARNWSGVASSADGTRLVACVYGGQIHTSVDSGMTWIARDSARSWYAVASSADGTKLAACVSGGLIYTSTDSGITWAACESVRNWLCVTASADGTKLAACVGGGQIYTLNTNGATVARTPIGTAGFITGAADSAVELQYEGGDIFRVLNHENVQPYQPVTQPELAASLAAKANAGDVFTWNTVASDTRMGYNNGYLATGSGMVTLTLPASSALNIGDTVRVSGMGAGGWKIAQNVSQVILTGNLEIPDYSGAWTARDSVRYWRSVASSSDGTKLVASVQGGQLYTSTDSGATWTARDSVRGWVGVASSADGTKMVACVNGGQIYTSTDSGVTWTARDSARAWWRVASSSDGTKLVASVYSGNIYTSTDSGVTWTARDSARGWWGVASSADGTMLVACVMNGQIYTSTNSGVTWTPRDSNRTWFEVASSSDGTKLVAGVMNGQIYTSTDSGATWTARQSARGWETVASSADGTKLVACVNGGQIYISTDSGVTWTARDSNRSWYGVASSADGMKLVACVSNGQIYTGSPLKVNTTAGTGGYLSGSQNTAVELQYIGSDTFVPLSHEGSLTAN